MPSPGIRDVLVFAGQGSNQYLTSPATARGLRELLGDEQNAAFQLFLSRCRDIFYEELASATAEAQSILDDASQTFPTPESLLFPPESYQSHPIVETLNLYVYEILELLLYQCHQENHHVIETAGICTGILPAILASSFTSYESDDFFDAAVEGFRLAFWVGLRASLHSRQVAGDKWLDTPSVLGVFGAKSEELEQRLTNRDEDKTSNATVRISAIFSDGNISVAGAGHDLTAFKNELNGSSIQSRWANVHALYHGGSDMAHLVSEVLDDAARRDVAFPTWESLHAPVRSVTSGVRHSLDSRSQETLLETALHSIFIDRVDWREAGARIHESSLRTLEGDSAARIRIAGMGPGSKALVRALKDLAAHSRLERVDNFVAALAQPRPDDIAVVGLSVNYPEGRNSESFWDVLQSGRSTAKRIPKDRFDMPQWHGNFLQDPFAFDPAYFNISPREAKSIDPQQRLLLHGALEALDDAGYSPDSTSSFQRDTFGVYVGVATGDYVDNLRDDIDVYYSPGTLRAFLAGRISYAFKFKGPSMVIDTACSSSTVALYHACVALRSGECTAALVGGVNVISSPDMYCGLGRAHFLSPTGQCKPFDQSADGYCRSEGCGVVVLKKLSDAVREGDHVYGVIRGIALNQCGTAKSITHPDYTTQAALVRNVLKLSRVTPDSVNAVEAHGTGTQAGDFAELSSLSSIFGPRPPGDPLYLSSVKGHVGHSEAASGIAGLAKLLLMMEKKKIPPQASYSTLNPRLTNLVEGRFHIPTKLQDWQRTSSDSFVRRALLNNFGASGSNAALVVEEYAPQGGARPSASVAQAARSHNVVNLSAKSESALERQISSLLSFIESTPSLSIDDLSYSANCRRPEYSPWKFSAVATSLSDLQKQLRDSPQTMRVDANDTKKTVFAFSGQGAVHAGMGAGLLSTVPLFQAIVDECDELLADNGFPTVKAFLESGASASDDVVISQCACFVLEYGLARTWMSWGLKPDLVVGHSIGEYAAFAFAGILSLEQALLLIANRAKLMVTKCPAQTTGMLVCKIPAPEVARLLNEGRPEFAGVTVSCINSSQDFVLGGPVESLTKFGEYCKAEGLRNKLLPVPYGFHSVAMDPILEDLTSLTADMTSKTPVIRVGSSLHGRVLDADAVLEQDYFVRHCREPVNFTALVEDISTWAAGSDLTVVEIGPSPSTEPMFKQTLTDTNHTFLASLRPNQDSWATLAPAMRALSLQNQALDWRQVYEGSGAKFLKALPGYAVAPASYYVPFKPPAAKGVQQDTQEVAVKAPQYAFLTGPAESSDAGESFSTRMNQISPFIKAHNVGGMPLCPASVYMEIVLQAAAQRGSINSQTSMCFFEDVIFGNPLVCDEASEASPALAVKTYVNTIQGSETLQFSSKSSSGQVLCSGRIRSPDKTKQVVPDIINRKSILAQRLKRSFGQNALDRGLTTQTLSSRTIYDIIFPRVVQYSEPYLTLKHLVLDGSGLEGHGIFTLKALQGDSDELFVSMPTFVDTLLHAAGFVANTHVNPDTACICVSVEQAMVPSDSSDLYGQNLEVYCTIGDIGHSFVADAYAFDEAGKLIAFVEGMCFKKMKLKPFQNHLARLAGQSPVPQAAPKASSAPALSRSVDRPTAAARGGSSENDTKKLYSLLRQVCGLDKDPSANTSLEELGMDSLLLIEFGDMLRTQFQNTGVSREDVEHCRTVGDLIKLIVDSAVPDDASETSETSLSASTGTASSAGEPVHPMTGDMTPPTPPQSDENSLIPLLRPLFVDICGLDPTNDYDGPLSSLGVDSLLSIELIHEIHAKLGVEIDPHNEEISELSYKQLEELCVAKVVKKNTQSSAKREKEQSRRPKVDAVPAPAPKSEPVQKVNGHSSSFPRVLQVAPGVNSHLYLFHDGSGLCSMYSRLSTLGCNVYGVSSLESPLAQMNADSTVRTVEELAAFYIQHTDILSRPSVIVGGWSFGGVLASEVARQLVKLGKAVDGIILIDSPAPVGHVALPAEVISYVLGKGNDGKTVNTSAAQGARAKIGAQFSRHAGMLQGYNPSRVEPRSQVAAIPVVILRCVQTIDTKKLCGVSYPWLSDLEAGNESIRLWEELMGRKIPVLELDCNHFDVFEGENIQAASKQLRQACELLSGN